jgi:hypothetical protein
VCGFLIPSKNQDELIKKGFGIRKLDGSVIFSCGRHSPEEILTSTYGAPKFTIAKLGDVK